MKTFYLLCLLIFCSAIAEAQTKTITGTVKDQTGGGLSGATVNAKGSQVATSTDPTGNFRLVVPEKTKVLVISFVGMEDKEVDLAGKSNIEVNLNTASSNLDQVVVVGYGTKKRARLPVLLLV